MSDAAARRSAATGSFGERLARLRQDRGLSQKDLATLADVSPSTINRVEGQARGVSRDLVDRLAAALNLSHDDRVALLLAADVVDAETAGLLRTPALGRLANVLGLPDLRPDDRAQLLLYVELALAYADALGYLVPAPWPAAPATDPAQGTAARDEPASAADAAASGS